MYRHTSRRRWDRDGSVTYSCPQIFERRRGEGLCLTTEISPLKVAMLRSLGDTEALSTIISEQPRVARSHPGARARDR